MNSQLPTHFAKKVSPFGQSQFDCWQTDLKLIGMMLPDSFT
jgi:hypothetical protein